MKKILICAAAACAWVGVGIGFHGFLIGHAVHKYDVVAVETFDRLTTLDMAMTVAIWGPISALYEYRIIKADGSELRHYMFAVSSARSQAEVIQRMARAKIRS